MALKRRVLEPLSRTVAPGIAGARWRPSAASWRTAPRSRTTPASAPPPTATGRPGSTWPAAGPGRRPAGGGPGRARRPLPSLRPVAHGGAGRRPGRDGGGARGCASTWTSRWGSPRGGYDVWRHRERLRPGRQHGAPRRTPSSPAGRTGGSRRSIRRPCAGKATATCGRPCATSWGTPASCASTTSWGCTASTGSPPGRPATEGVYVRYPVGGALRRPLPGVAAQPLRRWWERTWAPSPPRSTRPWPSTARTACTCCSTKPGPIRSTALPPVPPGTVASINTHDMPTFAACWTGAEIQDRVARGHLLPERGGGRGGGPRPRAPGHRPQTWHPGGSCPGRATTRTRPRPCRPACGTWPASQAETVVVGLEDLWLERRPAERARAPASSSPTGGAASAPAWRTWPRCPVWRRRWRQ